MRRVVQKRADDTDRRTREAAEKALKDSVTKTERAALENRKAEDRERLMREAKVRGSLWYRLLGVASWVRGLLLPSHRSVRLVLTLTCNCGLSLMP